MVVVVCGRGGHVDLLSSVPTQCWVEGAMLELCTAMTCSQAASVIQMLLMQVGETILAHTEVTYVRCKYDMHP